MRCIKRESARKSREGKQRNLGHRLNLEFNIGWFWETGSGISETWAVPGWVCKPSHARSRLWAAIWERTSLTHSCSYIWGGFRSRPPHAARLGGGRSPDLGSHHSPPPFRSGAPAGSWDAATIPRQGVALILEDPWMLNPIADMQPHPEGLCARAAGWVAAPVGHPQQAPPSPRRPRP